MAIACLMEDVFIANHSPLLGDDRSGSKRNPCRPVARCLLCFDERALLKTTVAMTSKQAMEAFSGAAAVAKSFKSAGK